MNNTLTGLGLALIAALAAALVGPFFIDWGDHRTTFERQASRIVGVPVRVLGDVDVRLLPSPRVRFGQIVAGDDRASSKFTADSFELDLALTPLLSGHYEVSKLRVDGAELVASLAVDGEISIPVAQRGVRAGDLDAIRIANLSVTNSRLVLADPAANKRHVVEGFTLNGQASALSGPVKFDASGRYDEAPLTLRVSTGRFDAEGAGEIKLSLENGGGPGLSLDGRLTLGSKPRFDGKAVLAQTAQEEDARHPWRMSGVVTSDLRRLDGQDIEIEYGAPGQDLRFTAGLGLVLGPKPSAKVSLKSRQIDLDRLLGRPKDAAPLAPFEVLTALKERFPALQTAQMPMQVNAALDGVMIGGDLVRDVRTSFASAPGGWNVETFTAGLPGNAVLELSGLLSLSEGGSPRFSGPVRLDAPNIPSLAHWVDGLAGERPAITVRSLLLEAALNARADAYALEDLKAEADGASVSGRLAVSRRDDGQRLIEARLQAESLDLDALDPLRILRGNGDSGGGGDIKAAVEVSLRAAKLTFAKVVWSGVDADLTSNADGVDIRRLTIADLGGARIQASGRLPAANEGAGSLEARIDAKSIDGVVSVLRSSALPPAFIDALQARSAAIAPASITARLDSSGGTAGVSARLSGSLGGTDIDLNAKAASFSLEGALEARLTASAKDGARLFGLLGLPSSALDSFGAAVLEADLKGDLAKGADVSAVMTADEDRIAFKGAARDGEMLSVSGRLDAKLDDAGRYIVALGRAAPLSLPLIPFDAGASVSLDKGTLKLASLSGSVDGRAFKGELSHDSKGLSGKLDVASLTLRELAGLAFGPSALERRNGGLWPSGAAGAGVLEGIAGRVQISTDRLDLVPEKAGGKARFTVQMGPNEIALRDGETSLAGGGFKANVTVRRAEGNLSVASRLSLEGGAMSDFLWHGQAGPAATGKLDVMADVLGTGKSIKDVVAALAGSGSFTLRDARLSGVDAGAFERTLIAVEAGSEAPDAAEIARRFDAELAMDDLEVSEMSAAFTLASGVVRISNAAVSAPLVNATASGTFDLSTRAIQARMTVRPKMLAELADSEVPSADLLLSGPWAGLRRQSQTTAFANVLAVRAVEREIARVEKLEAERQERERRAAEEEKRRQEEEARRKQEEAEAARLKAIIEATGEVPLGELPPPLDPMPAPEPQLAPQPNPAPRGRRADDQSPLDFLRKQAAPAASR